MTKFITGFVLGVVVGFVGIACMLDRGVDTIQQPSRDLVQ